MDTIPPKKYVVAQSKRPVYIIPLENLDERPDLSRYKCATAMLIVDKSVYEQVKVPPFLARLITGGITCLSTWGDNSKTIHAIAEKMIAHSLANKGPIDKISTACHDGDSLADAMWFYLSFVFPQPQHLAATKNSLFIVVGNQAVADKIGRYLIKPPIIM